MRTRKCVYNNEKRQYDTVWFGSYGIESPNAIFFTVDSEDPSLEDENDLNKILTFHPS